jgi:hypothetical protein
VSGPPQQFPSGMITAADLYREVTGMRTEVARAFERLSVVEVRNTASDQLHLDHETRLRALERFRYALMGAAGLIGAASGVVSALLATGGHL